MAVLKLGSQPLIEPYVIHIPNRTFEDLLQFADEDTACELLDGVLVIHSPASLEHERIFKFLLVLLELYGRRTETGRPLGSRFVMKLSPKWAPEPDLLFLSPATEKNLQQTFLEGPAEVVVEILSQTTRDDDLSKKLPAYLKGGVQEVWIVDPKQQHVEVHHPGQQPEGTTATEWLSSQVIVGFRIKPHWLWEVETTDPLSALEEMLGQDSS